MTIYRGWNAKLYIEGQEVGYVQEVSVDVDASVETYFAAGKRTVEALIPGPLEITGSFSRAFVNTTYLSLLSSSLQSFDMKITIGNKNIWLYGCKLQKGTLDIPQDGVITEDYDFVASSIAVEG